MRRVVALLTVLLLAGCSAPAAEPRTDEVPPEMPAQDSVPGALEPDETAAEAELPSSETAPAEAPEVAGEPEPVEPAPPICIEWGDGYGPDSPPLAAWNVSTPSTTGAYVERAGAWTLTVEPAFVEAVPGTPVEFTLRIEHDGDAPAAELSIVGRWAAFAGGDEPSHEKRWSVVEGEPVTVRAVPPPGERVGFLLRVEGGEHVGFAGPLVAPASETESRPVPAVDVVDETHVPRGLVSCDDGEALSFTFGTFPPQPGQYQCGAEIVSRGGDWQLVLTGESEWTLVGWVLRDTQDYCLWRGDPPRVVVELPGDAPRPSKVVVFESLTCAFKCAWGHFGKLEMELPPIQDASA